MRLPSRTHWRFLKPFQRRFQVLDACLKRLIRAPTNLRPRLYRLTATASCLVCDALSLLSTSPPG